jgi:hypothetical protein
VNHQFDAPVQGTFSVWWYDNRDWYSGGMLVSNTTEASELLAGYSLGSSIPPNSINAAPTYTKVADRSIGWHHLEYIVTDAGTSYYLDDANVGSGTLMNATQVALRNNVWNGWQVDGPYIVYYDDFSFTPAASPVPIPGAVWLLGSGLVGLVVVRRRSKK